MDIPVAISKPNVTDVASPNVTIGLEIAINIPDAVMAVINTLAWLNDVSCRNNHSVFHMATTTKPYVSFPDTIPTTLRSAANRSNVVVVVVLIRAAAAVWGTAEIRGRNAKEEEGAFLTTVVVFCTKYECGGDTSWTIKKSETCMFHATISPPTSSSSMRADVVVVVVAIIIKLERKVCFPLLSQQHTFNPPIQFYGLRNMGLARLGMEKDGGGEGGESERSVGRRFVLVK